MNGALFFYDHRENFPLGDLKFQRGFFPHLNIHQDTLKVKKKEVILHFLCWIMLFEQNETLSFIAA